MAMAASGCGGDDEEADTTTSTRFPPTVAVNNQELTEGTGVCGVLTRAEVEAAVGTPVDPGRGVRTSTNESCKWTLRTGNDQSVNVILSPDGVQLYEGASNTLRPEPLPGVGDRAFVATDTVYALKGTKLVILQVVSRQAAGPRRQAAVRLMETAISRA
jgi:hypothetical protein